MIRTMRRNRSVSLRGAIHTVFLRFDDGTDSYPTGLAFAANGDLLIANSLGHRICTLTPNGTLSLLAGGGAPGFVDGVGDRARFNNPKAVAVDADGLLYVADCENHAIRTVNTATGAVAT